MSDFMLAVPLKKASDVDVVKPLKNLIQSAYSGASAAGAAKAAPDYAAIAQDFGKLRSSALAKFGEKYESSLDVVYGYYDQLCVLESKIPAYELQIPFKWKDAFDKGSLFGSRISLTLTSLPYEKVCVLFNIAALQSNVAQTQSFDSDAGLKLATKLYQLSAGIFEHLRNVAPAALSAEPTPDLNPDTLHALGALMLAQAQECFVLKAIRDALKPGMIARLASQCEALYADALSQMQREPMRNVWDRDWLPLIAGKQTGMLAIAQLHQSHVCGEKKQVGEQIARLQLAADLLKTARSRSGRITLYDGQTSSVAGQLDEARKDNDMIYNEMIPDAKALQPVAKAALAKAIAVDGRMSKADGARQLFGDLVPVALHQALQTCDARRAEFVNGEIMRLRDATQTLNGVLASLNLPAAIEVTTDGSLPASLLDKASDVRRRGGIDSVRTLVKELPDLLQRNREILDETERVLNDERESDDKLRAQFNERWKRTPSLALTEMFRSNVGKYREVINCAVTADQVVREKFDKHSKGIELLSKTPGELEEALPTGGPGGSTVNSSSSRALWQLMDRVTALKAERDGIETDLKSSTVDLKDKFLAALAADGAIDEPSLSVPGIGQALNPLRDAAAKSLETQATIVAELQTAHAAFVAANGTASGKAEAFLSELATAYNYFVELQDNLNEGIKFYNNLTELLLTLQTKITDFCFARKTEKDELLKDLTQESSRTASATTPAVPAHFPTPAARQAPPPPTANAPGNVAPYPQQVQGMPMPYGAPAGAPYASFVPPPMPTGYNPYATLPYPNAAYNYQNFPAGPPMQHYGTYPGNYAHMQQQQQQPGYPPQHHGYPH